MNWRNGLLRLWAVLSACWLAATIFAFWSDLTCSTCEVIKEAKKPAGYEDTTSVRRSDGKVVAVATLLIRSRSSLGGRRSFV